MLLGATDTLARLRPFNHERRSGSGGAQTTTIQPIRLQMKQKLIRAIDASLDAGQAILEVYESDFAIEHKEDRSPLTLADRRSHDIIMAPLQDTPHPILSEEGRSITFEERKTWDTFWLVDPLDGTKEFIKRNGEFTVNIAWCLQDRIGLQYLPGPVDRSDGAGPGLRPPD